MQTVHRDGTFVLAVRPGTPGLPQEPLLRLATWLHRKHRNKGDIVMKNTTVVRDPVCGMDVELATAAGRTDYKGQPYYFCGSRLRGGNDDLHHALGKPRRRQFSVRAADWRASRKKPCVVGIDSQAMQPRT